MRYLKYILIAVIGFGLAACSPKKQVKNDMDTAFAAEEVIEDIDQAEEIEIEEEPEIAEVLEVPESKSNISNIKNVNFAFDKYNLDHNAREILAANAEILKENQDGATIIIEGHCDERGTIEYNIALGQKRAAEVKKFYVQLGIPSSSIKPVSYGKEKPSCFESEEGCWSKNRRAETILR